MSRLLLCDACSRHVRAGESSCPFCGAPVGAPAAEPVHELDGTVRYSRAKLCALAAALAACNAARPAPAYTPNAGAVPGPEPSPTVATVPPEDAKAPDVVVEPMRMPQVLPRPLYGSPPAFVVEEV